MDITRTGSIGAAPEWNKLFDQGGQSANFHEQLQAVQESGNAATPAGLRGPSKPIAPHPAALSTGAAVASSSGSLGQESRYLAASITYNGQSVTFDQLPAKVQQQLREQEESWAKAEAYRARVAADPDIGPAAKMRPYDAATDEVAMAGLAMMDPATAKMTPEQFYNYMGSDRAKYDTILRAADYAPGDPMADAQKRIFGADLEQESKVRMVRDYRAEGKELPDSYADFERAWQADMARQKALDEERRKLLQG